MVSLYQTSPFVDIRKSNPYYYCIAEAKTVGITQGYILDQTQSTTCEDGSKYTSSPFCANNSTSRIEATAMLLRRANLWNDTLNSGDFDRSIDIPDATTYWYGYAKKWIEFGLISRDKTGRIWADTNITRGEFAIMAAKTLAYTQCQTSDLNTIESSIQVTDAAGNIVSKSSFAAGEKTTLTAITGTGNVSYKWTLHNIDTNTALTQSGKTLTTDTLTPGTWTIRLDIIDDKTGKIIGTSTITITIWWVTSTAPSVILSSSTLSAYIDDTISFRGVTSGSGLLYRWDYGDGVTSTDGASTTHAYSASGVYTVSLTVTDPVTDRSSISELSIRILAATDSDGDGAADASDLCPLVSGSGGRNGCPIVQVWTYGNSVSDILAGLTTSPSGSSILSGMGTNACLARYRESRGLTIGAPVCDQCPCANRVDLLADIRSCDILFPTILSPDQSMIYSRGAFYQIP
jgi:PKD repeat protein